jgi:hypothetical protein
MTTPYTTEELHAAELNISLVIEELRHTIANEGIYDRFIRKRIQSVCDNRPLEDVLQDLTLRQRKIPVLQAGHDVMQAIMDVNEDDHGKKTQEFKDELQKFIDYYDNLDSHNMRLINEQQELSEPIQDEQAYLEVCNALKDTYEMITDPQNAQLLQDEGWKTFRGSMAS